MLVPQEPKINLYVHSFITFGGDCEQHIHNNIEFIYVRSSRGLSAECNGEEHNLTSGAFYTIFPNHTHSHLKKKEISHCLTINLDPNLLNSNLSHIFLNKSPVCPVIYPKDEALIELLHLIHNEYNNASDYYIIEGLLNAFFGKLLKYYDLKNTPVELNKISEILKYCNEHFTEDITLETISKALFINQNTISRIFSKYLKTNFKKHINNLRINESCRLLSTTQHSITDISFLSGFSSTRTFNHTFIEQLGITPAQYKKTKNIIIFERIKKACRMIESGSHTLHSLAENCGFMSINEFISAFIAEKGITPQEYQKITLEQKAKNEKA